jgi:hypothetical protein
LKRFNEEIFKVEEFLELVPLETLIRGIREHVIWRELYALPEKSLFKVN